MPSLSRNSITARVHSPPTMLEPSALDPLPALLAGPKRDTGRFHPFEASPVWAQNSTDRQASSYHGITHRMEDPAQDEKTGNAERCPAAQITGHFKMTLDARKRTARLFQARIRAITACAGYGNALKTAPDSGLNFKASLPELRAPARAS